VVVATTVGNQDFHIFPIGFGMVYQFSFTKIKDPMAKP